MIHSAPMGSLPAGPSIAEIAAEEFGRRRDTARRKVAAGELAPREADAHLRPWLAIAAMAGADLPELYEERDTIFPYARAGETVRVRIPSDDIVPRDEALKVLATARDVAIERADGGSDPVRNDRARRLQTLAIALGAPAYLPSRLKETA